MLGSILVEELVSDEVVHGEVLLKVGRGIRG